MNRRQHLPAALSLISIILLENLNSSPALAGLFNWLDNIPNRTELPAIERNPAPDYEFQEIYEGSLHLTRGTLARLTNGQVYHWSDLASKPYGRLKSNDGLEHYFFKFGFGEGGVILISDSKGIVSDWEITGQALAPEYNPPDMSQYVYEPPRKPADSPSNGCL
jgi:hypothetical protein